MRWLILALNLAILVGSAAFVAVHAGCGPPPLPASKRVVVEDSATLASVHVTPSHDINRTRTDYHVSTREVTRDEPEIRSNIFTKGQHVEMVSKTRTETVREPYQVPYVETVPTMYALTFATAEHGTIATESDDDVHREAASWSVGTRCVVRLQEWRHLAADGRSYKPAASSDFLLVTLPEESAK